MRTTSANIQPDAAAAPSRQEILIALSFALDATEGAAPGHAARSCLLAVRIALSLGLNVAAISHLYYATLLRDVGSGTSRSMYQIVEGEEPVRNAGLTLEYRTSLPSDHSSHLDPRWSNLLPEGSTLERGARLPDSRFTQHHDTRELLEGGGDRGIHILQKLGFSGEVAAGISSLNQHGNSAGHPQSLFGEDVPVLSRIMRIAQHLDVLCMSRGPRAALDTLRERSGRWSDADLVDVACSLDRGRTLWRQCMPEEAVEVTCQAALDLYPHKQEQLSALNIDSICEAFADVVDAKSPFTFRHSLGVMNASVAIGNTLGLSQDRLQVLRRAALLHDIGKLSISNRILDKPGQLTEAESLLVKGHPGSSAQILDRIVGFREISTLAGEHHEKLDGSGYPFNLRSQDLSLESKVLAVADIYTALSERRPYREALASEQITAIMNHDVPAKLDGECYAALCLVMDELAGTASNVQEPPFHPHGVPSFAIAQAGL